MKLAVEASVVHELRLSDGVSRVELARRLQIAPSTIGIHVQRLVRDGFLREGKRAETAAGRPPTILELNPDAGQFIGIDLDAHQVRGISIDFAQRTLAHHIQPIGGNASAEEAIGRMVETIEQVNRNSCPLLGIGLAVPGTVDIERGMALHYKFIRDWRQLPLTERICERFAVPVYLENNIRSMALAERWFGQGRDVNDYLCIGIRSGIGSGLIINGELYQGSGNVAGEIGSWPCVDSQTGRTKTLEEIASIPALLETMAALIRSGRSSLVKLKRDRVELDGILDAVARGDKLAGDVLDNAAEALGRVIAQVHLLINPQRVIIAGPLAGQQAAFLTPIQDAMTALLPEHHRVKPIIVGSQLDSFVGALGAAACAVHAWRPESMTPSSHLCE